MRDEEKADAILKVFDCVSEYRECKSEFERSIGNYDPHGNNERVARLELDDAANELVQAWDNLGGKDGG